MPPAAVSVVICRPDPCNLKLWFNQDDILTYIPVIKFIQYLIC